MIDNNTINQQAIRKMANGIRMAFFLSLITDAYDIYRFFDTPGGLRQGISIALGILGTILIWQLSRQLRAEKRQALFYWLSLLFIGYIRWIFVDAAFELNLFSIFLLALAIGLTLKMVIWMRKGVLT